MALVDITIDFDLAQLLGSDFDARRTKAYVTTNVESGTLMDTTTGETRLGDEAVTINSDGTGSFTTWATGADGNPISWQTSLVVDYPRAGQRDRKRRVFGPWTLTTADDGKNIVELEAEQAVPAEYLTTVTNTLDGYVTDAETAQAGAEAARDLAVDISNIDSTDTAVAAGFQIPGSASGAYLSATHVGRSELVIDVRRGEFAVSEDTADVTANTQALQAAIEYIYNNADPEHNGLGKLLIAGDIPINDWLIMQPGVHLTGAGGWTGIGGVGGLGGHGTGRPRLRHATAIDKPFIIFTENVDGAVGPLAITNLQLKGHASETTAPGIDTRTSAGGVARLQDGCWIDKIVGRTLGGPVVRARGGGPGRIGDLMALFCEGTLELVDDGSNGEYGNVQHFTIGTLSGDGNYGDYTLKISGTLAHSGVSVRSVKSEQRADIDRASALGSQNAVILNNCQNLVEIQSGHHTSITSVRPGDAILVTGTTRPTLHIGSAFGVRDISTQTGAYPLLINDAVAGENRSRHWAGGHFGPRKQAGGPDRALRLPGTNGNYVTTPDSAALDIIGDIEIQAKVTLTALPAAQAAICGKYLAAGNQRAYFWRVETDGKLTFQHTTDGASGTAKVATSTASIAASKKPIHLKVTRATATGTVKFYTSPDGNTWTQLGTDVATTAGAIYASTCAMNVGAVGDGTSYPFSGTIHEVAFRNAIGGSDVAVFDAVAHIAHQSDAAVTGETWTIVGHAWRWERAA